MTNEPTDTGGEDPVAAAIKQLFEFKPPDYNAFAEKTGFGYGSWHDQMKDAFSMPSRGAGVFAGNSAPRYGKPAPNMTFPGAFQQLLGQQPGGAAQQNFGQQQGGGLLGGPRLSMQGLLAMIQQSPGAMPPRTR